jgi:four helix bundle protein
MSIALKEARETHYWLRLIRDSNLIPEDMENYISDAYELVKILTSIVKTSQNK